MPRHPDAYANDDATTTRALEWLERNSGKMESLLRDLVCQNSFTQNREGGNRVGDMLREAFSRGALSCEKRPSTRFADHLIFRTSAEGAPIALVGHLDTVFPPSTFEGYRRDGALARGPGILDMKGGLVVAGFALLALDEIGLLEKLPVRFVIVADEEVGSPEGQLILREIAGNATAALVFEAGRMNDAVVTQRKGVASMRAVAKGRAAHAGSAHREGINAIWALSHFVDQVQGLTDYAAGSTVNVGKIGGGQSKNTVPDEAFAELDIRFTSRDSAERLLTAIHRAAETSAARVPGSDIVLEGGISRLPLERSEQSAQLCAAYSACAIASGLGGGESPLEGGGSDANTLSSVGVPAIDGLGPRGSGFHTKDEYIELATLVPRASALVRLLARTIADLD